MLFFYSVKIFFRFFADLFCQDTDVGSQQGREYDGEDEEGGLYVGRADVRYGYMIRHQVLNSPGLSSYFSYNPTANAAKINERDGNNGKPLESFRLFCTHVDFAFVGEQQGCNKEKQQITAYDYHDTECIEGEGYIGYGFFRTAEITVAKVREVFF